MAGLALDKRGAGALSEKKGASVFSEKTGGGLPSEKKGTTPQQAAFAASLASQTLFQRMGSAFWDAFSSGPSKDVDTNKVRRVLEGKAVVRVVDVDGLDALEEKMRGMSVGVTGGVFGNLRGKK
ncbi:hypothetical protein BN14_06100 [Rhizoctonia solani AG-1 IB]|nr:hypothetical protein BN14_06100 [Rhizoctonia solani AG-1 IB]